MRILMVTEDIPAPQVGGLGKHVVTLANALIAQGHHVDLMGRSDREYAMNAAEIGFHGEFIPGFNFAHTGWKETQFKVFFSPKRPAIARRIAGAINQLASSYDVVHYHGHLPLVGKYIPEAVNFVQTRHDQGSECLTHTRFRNGDVCNATEPQACAKCMHPNAGPIRSMVSAAAVRRYRVETAEAFARHKTIFVSDFLRRQFLRAVPMANLDRSHVIHNFVDVGRLNRLINGDQKIIEGSMLLAARIDQPKGFRAFLAEASSKICNPLCINIVGDGPDKAHLEACYASQSVKFLGWTPYDEVIRLTASTHVCVVPSICEESCGTTILEALALGRPCMALSRGGSPELLRYQRYEGQLQLAQNMKELVSLAFEIAEKQAIFLPLNAHFEANVSEAIHSILKVYSK